MQRFKSILVVVDEKTENRAVVERAVTLAQRNQAHLTLVNTVGPLPRQAPRLVTPELPVDAREPALDIIEEWPTDASPPARREPSAPLSKPRSERPDGAHVTVAEAAVVIREQIVEEESQRLDKWVGSVQRSGVPVDGKMLYGTPFLEIIREVLRSENDQDEDVLSCHRASCLHGYGYYSEAGPASVAYSCSRSKNHTNAQRQSPLPQNRRGL